MLFGKQTIKDVNLAGKTVLVRADYNVPINENGGLGELYRVEASLPTLNYLLEQDCKVIIMSHLGRPEGKVDLKFSLKPVADKLSELLNRQVHFVNDCIGDEVAAAAKALEHGEVLLLENLRFYSEEEANDEAFAKQLASFGEVFVQDGFGVVHRAHASTEALTKFLPAVAGLLLEKEVSSIKEAIENPKQPLLVILGGVKVTDKIELIDRFLDIAKQIVIGGAMANTFLKQMGRDIGKSIYETEALDEAKRVLETATARGIALYLPVDVAVAKDRSPAASRTEKGLDKVGPDEFILDFGPQSIKEVDKLIVQAGSVIWNGAVGVTEFPAFAAGSMAIAEAVEAAGVPSLAGGGDTAAFLESSKMLGSFDLVSTGGGSALELMAGKTLPGVEALLDK